MLACIFAPQTMAMKSKFIALSRLNSEPLDGYNILKNRGCLSLKSRDGHIENENGKEKHPRSWTIFPLWLTRIRMYSFPHNAVFLVLSFSRFIALGFFSSFGGSFILERTRMKTSSSFLHPPILLLYLGEEIRKPLKWWWAHDGGNTDPYIRLYNVSGENKISRFWSAVLTKPSHVCNCIKLKSYSPSYVLLSPWKREQN